MREGGRRGEGGGKKGVREGGRRGEDQCVATCLVLIERDSCFGR